MDLVELAVKARQGDEEAFLERMDADKHKLYGIAYSYMLNQQDALDAVQETVSKVWAKCKSLKQPEYFTTWVIRILIRVCMDEQKKKRREVPTAADQMGYGIPKREYKQPLSFKVKEYPGYVKEDIHIKIK